MQRVFNFAAGPATMPLEVLEQAQKDLTNYKDVGMSVMEMSHRGNDYEKIHNHAKETLKELLKLDDDKEILFLQGGASTQFTMIPMNLLEKDDKASYLISGSWAKKAYNEAKLLANPEIISSSEDDNFTYIPEFDAKKVNKDSKYIYICTNNTIYGTAIRPSKLEKFDINKPLVADMSSNILSENYDMNKFDLVFAGAQKNLGPAGVTIVIIKKDLLSGISNIPTMLDYNTHINKNSMFNTPPCFAIYMCSLVLDWLKKNGGVDNIEKVNAKKAKLLYDFLDNSKLFNNPVKKEDRSIMNVVFTTGNKDKDMEFIESATKNGLYSLKGHRSAGGMRASIYNAMSYEGVEALVNFMKKFEKENS